MLPPIQIHQNMKIRARGRSKICSKGQHTFLQRLVYFKLCKLYDLCADYLCNYGMRATLSNIWANWYSHVPIKLYLCILKFKSHITFTCPITCLLFFIQLVKPARHTQSENYIKIEVEPEELGANPDTIIYCIYGFWHVTYIAQPFSLKINREVTMHSVFLVAVPCASFALLNIIIMMTIRS